MEVFRGLAGAPLPAWGVICQARWGEDPWEVLGRWGGARLEVGNFPAMTSVVVCWPQAWLGNWPQVERREISSS